MAAAARGCLAIMAHQGSEEQEQELGVAEVFEKSKPAATSSDQWQVTFSRFINYPSLVPLSRRSRRNGGTWISSNSATAFLQLLNCHSNYEDAILLLSLNATVLEEHFVWKLHFSWPQASCVSGYPARGSRAVFMSYKDSVGEIQKFAVRFSTVSEAKMFIEALKVILEDPSRTEPLNSYFQSAISSPSAFMPTNGCPSRTYMEESSTPSPFDTYSPQLPMSFNYQDEQPSCTEEKAPNDNHGGSLPALPPSFSSLLLDCCSGVKQATNQPSLSHEIDLKSQIMKYIGDSSFQDILTEVERVIVNLEMICCCNHFSSGCSY